MLVRIAQIIKTEINHPLGMRLAENLRAAAWYVMDEFPDAKARDFGDAALRIGLHRQGSINRWNEAKKNLLLTLGDQS